MLVQYFQNKKQDLISDGKTYELSESLMNYDFDKKIYNDTANKLKTETLWI